MAKENQVEWRCDYPACTGAGITIAGQVPPGWLVISDRVVCPLQDGKTIGELKLTLGI